MREGKKASSFAIFSIANVLAFVRLLTTIFANLVIYCPAVVANVSSQEIYLSELHATLPKQVTTLPVSVTTLPTVVATLPEQETTFTSVVTTFTMQETTLSMSVTKPPKVIT